MQKITGVHKENGRIVVTKSELVFSGKRYLILGSGYEARVYTPISQIRSGRVQQMPAKAIHNPMVRVRIDKDTWIASKSRQQLDKYRDVVIAGKFLSNLVEIKQIV